MKINMIVVNIIVALFCTIILAASIIIAFLGEPKPLVAIISLAVIVYAILNIMGLSE